jgi:hypothetical protein
VGAFNAIDIRGPISIEVESGKEQSLTLRGDQKFLGNVITEVVDGELKISLKDKDSKKTEGDPRVIITMPTLRKLIAEGAGEDPHQAQWPAGRHQLQGRGPPGRRWQCRLAAPEGAGRGRSRYEGLAGEERRREFRRHRQCQVYSSGELNAVVRGMGELTYYGKPKIVHKSIAGIGNVNAGK